ncbi:GH3 auxin-responsive promoter family protein [Candidatus Poribacteria bacterium]|nr:GH3 auxin-responsive promoter family protein [Candidatus Poribacteria bacterium]
MIENLLYFALRTVLNRSWNELILATSEPARMQSARLLDIISRNQDTAFGREHGFSGIRCVRDLRERVPVRSYEEFEPYIKRMRLGEENLLTAETPEIFCRTSGSMGEPKFIPVTLSFYEEFSKMQKMWQRKLVADHREMLRGKILSVMSPEIDGYTECGTPYGAMSGHCYRRQYPITQARYAVPYEVMCIRDFEAKYYLILRLALEQNVTALAAMNPGTLLLLGKKLRTYLPRLARDIHDGAIEREMQIESCLRRLLEDRLRPDKKRAREIETLCNGRDIRLTDMWKNLSVILTWQGGSAGFYLREFPRCFPGVPLRDFGLVATEGYFSFPLWSNTPNALLAITGHFFEFFEVGPDGNRADVAHECEEIEKGKDYFIVVTTSGGLYRYDICDIVTVVDFYNKTPVIVFKQKGGNTISITGEKVTEAQVTEAFRVAAQSWMTVIDGFTVTLRLSDPPSYVLVVETTERREEALAGLLAAFECELRLRNIEYAAKRDSQRLGAPSLRLLEPGFFEERRKQRVKQGVPDGQYKVPHIMKDAGGIPG